MAHKITYFDDQPWQQWARCRCGFTTEKFRTRDAVEDEVAKHERDIEALRLQLGTRTPSLKSQRDYFRKMAEDENVSPADRRQWGRLADELDARIEDPIKTADQPQLF